MRVAVWGASGFIGSALCAVAEGTGWTVVRLPRVGVDAAALEGAQIAYHCAGAPTETDPRIFANAAEKFASACAAAGVSRLVHLSTVAVYGLKISGEIGVEAPLKGKSEYAESRILAERSMERKLAKTDSRLCVVRVPTILGRGMTGTVITRFARAVGWGIFLHPGSADAVLACLGVRRLAKILVRIGELSSPPPVTQFSDHLRWISIASRVGELRGRSILRIPLPALGGKLAMLASTARYRDDTLALFRSEAGLPTTKDDLDAALGS